MTATTAARAPERTDRATTTAPAPTADTGRRRVSARVRILMGLLLVMALALASVAMTTRSFLLRDVDHRIDRLLTQEAGEFANAVERGGDPRTGRPFTDADRLLTVFLERAFAAQREFVDDAGHELRPPHHRARAPEGHGDDPAEREETVRLVTDELDRMSRIQTPRGEWPAAPSATGGPSRPWPARSARVRARCRAWTPAMASCPPRWSWPRPCCARANSSQTPRDAPCG
ncbi:signal transduction histidine kinase [Streptomyces sp. AK010]|nr:signal transduction histidine kinase [Streptomyces sp. AK010]